MTTNTQSPDGKEQRPARPLGGRGSGVALALSLAVNLLLIGLIAGAMARGPAGRHGMIGGDAGFGPLTAGLSHADRRALRERYEALRPDFRAERAAMHEDFLALAQVLNAPEWDRAAAEAILARNGARTADRLREGQAVFLDYLDTLSPATRQALAARLAAALAGRGGKP